jgi:hypothetical protein
LMEESTGTDVMLSNRGSAAELDVRPFEVVTLRVVTRAEAAQG